MTRWVEVHPDGHSQKMAESDGYSDEEGRLAAISDEEGRVAAYFPDDFKQYVDTQLNRCPVMDNYDEDIFCGWVFWSREDDQSEHLPSEWVFYYVSSLIFFFLLLL
ncbi:hypothetical protein LOK49_LG13G00954 [Camellia lanceoleosa]|uniref:Uncharacterized protein n=1 Tax=Camellia lanceoleosa TaxID=1840588 RepID=A0ACC0FP01_9ERIC|nr:hypothetical protein LOK49_LG13G00954 [Camellia lanceoleosa]